MDLADNPLEHRDYTPVLFTADGLCGFKPQPTWDEAFLALLRWRKARRFAGTDPCNRRTHPGAIVRRTGGRVDVHFGV